MEGNDKMSKKNKQEITQKEKIPLGEKIEDKADDIFGAMEDAIFGENPDFSKDVPASMVNGSGVRKINKVQTRKNLNKKILGKKGYKIMGIVIIVMLIIGLIVTLIESMF